MNPLESIFGPRPAPSQFLGVGKGALYITLALLPGGLLILLVLLVVRGRLHRGGSMRLGAAQTLAVTLPVGTWIRVIDGTLWATTSGSLDDRWLRAGEVHQVPSGGMTVLEAVSSAATFQWLPSID